MSKPNTELVERIEEILAYFFDNAYKYSSRTIQHPSMTTSHIKTVEALEQLIIDEKIAEVLGVHEQLDLLNTPNTKNPTNRLSILRPYLNDRIKSLKELRKV